MCIIKQMGKGGGVWGCLVNQFRIKFFRQNVLKNFVFFLDYGFYFIYIDKVINIRLFDSVIIDILCLRI